jgi:hypothetical protein
MKNLSKYPLILLFALIALLNGCDLNNNNEPEPTDQIPGKFRKTQNVPAFVY